MGVNVEVKLYDVELLINKFEVVKGIKDVKLLKEILSKFGHLIANRYILLNNEYCGEFNPYYNLAEMIDFVFGVEDSFYVLMFSDYIKYCGVDMDDVVKELGIDEEKFDKYNEDK